jgi:Holliday junction resolvasome RuvABC endonuclease subunit
MNHEFHRNLVLSIYPTSRGYAFVLFEGPLSPVDYGVKEIRKKQKNERTLESIRTLIERYRPDYLVIEDHTVKGSRRSSRIRRLYRMLVHLAETEQIEVLRFSQQAVRECFASVGAKTKYEIAKAIAQEIPAFTHRLPKLRKIWMSEDPRQSLFDAAALGMVFYATRNEGFQKKKTIVL